LSEDHVAKVKDVLKVGQEVEARVIKVDKIERRIGLSIKAANYSEEQLRKEVESFDTLRPGEDMVGLEKSFRRCRTGRIPSRRIQACHKGVERLERRLEKGAGQEIVLACSSCSAVLGQQMRALFGARVWAGPIVI